MAIDVSHFYEQYGPMVLRRCRRLLRDDFAARDATQDVFVQLLLHQNRLDQAKPANLLLRMATNVCLNKLRTQHRRPEARSEDDLMERIAGTFELERSSAMRALLGRLFGETQESSQAIAVMHLVDGLTLEEVAREVDMSVSGVRLRLRKLKSRLQELGGLE